jgi:hypothetical protein
VLAVRPARRDDPLERLADARMIELAGDAISIDRSLVPFWSPERTTRIAFLRSDARSGGGRFLERRRSSRGADLAVIFRVAPGWALVTEGSQLVVRRGYRWLWFRCLAAGTSVGHIHRASFQRRRMTP